MTALAVAAGIAVAIVAPIDGGVALLVVNLAAFALFGHGVEDALGRARFVALIVAGGLVALGAVAVAGSPAHWSAVAYGAVAATLGAYAALRPRAKILTVVLAPLATSVVELPALALIALWLALEVALGVSAAGHGAAWLAHLAALPAGAAAAWPARRAASAVPVSASKRLPAA